LGVELADLIAAHTDTHPESPTLADHINAVAPTFSPGTTATYGSYWRLAIKHLGRRATPEDHRSAADSMSRAHHCPECELATPGATNFAVTTRYAPMPRPPSMGITAPVT